MAVNGIYCEARLLGFNPQLNHLQARKIYTSCLSSCASVFYSVKWDMFIYIYIALNEMCVCVYACMFHQTLGQ